MSSKVARSSIVDDLQQAKNQPICTEETGAAGEGEGREIYDVITLSRADLRIVIIAVFIQPPTYSVYPFRVTLRVHRAPAAAINIQTFEALRARAILNQVTSQALIAHQHIFSISTSKRTMSGDTPQWTATTVRRKFIDYFVERSHTFWPSSSTIPYNDPSLLFANAGMNQYKAKFLGQDDKDTDMGKLTRAVNSQKCIRAGGKHNDLDDVGKDVYHHTFFEMLGNWSFGDYWKEEAINFSWDLLVNVFKLDPERLYITYFEGDDEVPADEETRKLWTNHVPESRILPFDRK
eukprot:gene5451-8903_t